MKRQGLTSSHVFYIMLSWCYHNGRRLHSLPSQGGVYMEYLVIMAIILLFATGYIYTVKKK